MLQNETTTRIYRQCEAGDEAAAAEIVRRYGDDLCRLAERQIGRRLRTRVDPQDLVQSVFRTFFRGSRAKQWAIDRQGELWRLLVALTVNRARRKAERERAQKRDVRRERLTAPGALDVAVGACASPAAAAELEDEVNEILARLKPTEAAQFRAWLGGQTVQEAATAIGCSRWTVQRTRDRISEIAARRLEEFAD